MAQITVRNLDDAVLARLRRHAAAGHSTEEDARAEALIRDARRERADRFSR